MKNDVLTVLAVDDDSVDADLLHRQLEDIPDFQVDFVHVSTVADAHAALSRGCVDLAFIDYRLGAQTGLDLLSEIRAGGDLRPVICLTGQGDEHIATRCMHAGADEYLVKSDLSPDLLRRAIATSTTRSLQRRLEEQNKRLLKELQVKNDMLEKNGRRLAQMYETAHQFVDDVSHEFRTPLTVIKEFSSILYDGIAGKINQEQAEYLGIVLGRVDELSDMVDDMLDISRLEAGHLNVNRKVSTVESIVEPIRTALERRAAARSINLDIELDENLVPVYCDPDKISRVVINLTVNALKFSPQKSNVRLSAAYDDENAQVIVAVADRGPGIHPDSVDALFERFSQIGTISKAAVKGFGLGLNISKELVHLNFGDISVKSKVGHGSTFSFTIPTAEPPRFIRRYLKRVGAFRENADFVSLASIRFSEIADADAHDQFEEFIHQHIRRGDLLFRAQPDCWLLVMTSGRCEIEAVFRRIHDARIDSNRNNPLAQIPQIEFEKLGMWSIADNVKGFLERFESEFALQEVSHA